MRQFLLVFLVFGSVSCESLQSFYGLLGFENHLSNKLLLGNRFKRSADPMAAICMQQCATDMKNKMEQDTSLNLKTVSNGLLNRQLFEDDNLDDFCRIYTEGRSCIDNCGDFPTKKVIHSVFKPIDYMCVVRFNEFKKYINCLSRGSDYVARSCDNKCGGTGYAAQALEKMRAVTQLDETIELMNDMCGHIECSLDCELERYAEVCESEAPADLLRDFTRVAMKQSQRIMKQAQVDYLFPGKCRQLIRELNKEYKDRKEAEKAVDETKIEVQPVIDETVPYEITEKKLRKPEDPYLF